MIKVLFTCTGNTCRSPMAEYLLKEMAKSRKKEIEVFSRGFDVQSKSISEEAVELVRELYPQSPINLHIPTEINCRDIVSSNLILTMSEAQKKVIPHELTNRIFTLKEFAQIPGTNKDIIDPACAGFYSKEELIESKIILGSESYRFKFAGKVYYVDPSESRKGYVKCRDEILQCLESIFANSLL
jgi:protein-tyrosine phosphatase